MKKITFIVLFLSFTLTLAMAQTVPTKQGKDFYQTKTPGINYSATDTSQTLFEEEENFEGEDAEPSDDFNPSKEMSIVSEDTSGTEEGETSVVEVAEQVRFDDSTWVTYAEYYAIWDSRSVNPYRIDGSKFDDTLTITLYDSANSFNTAMPLEYSKITSPFGARHSRWHYGIDLDLETGEPVYAAFDGMVRICQMDRRGYGNYVLLRHYNGFETLYGHLSRQDVKVGQLVKAGERLGLGGSTGRSSGPHLHYEVRYEGNPINPEFFYDFSSHKLRSKIFTLMPTHFDYLRNARKVYYHKIRSGETLSVISRKYRVPVKTICRLNHITPRTLLRVGRRLRIR